MVVHDEDPMPNPVPSGMSKEKITSLKNTFAMNNVIRRILDQKIGKIFMLSPDFEGQSGISKTQAEKLGKSIAALKFFQDKKLQSDIPIVIMDLVRTSFE